MWEMGRAENILFFTFVLELRVFCRYQRAMLGFFAAWCLLGSDFVSSPLGWGSEITGRGSCKISLKFCILNPLTFNINIFIFWAELLETNPPLPPQGSIAKGKNQGGRRHTPHQPSLSLRASPDGLLAMCALIDVICSEQRNHLKQAHREESMQRSFL